MGRHPVKTAVLTSSRADFGIYLPLLKKLQSDEAFDLEIIAFGTHPEEKFGFSLQHIINQGFKIQHSLKTAPDDDTPGAISRSMALVTTLMTDVWENSAYEVVFALGDRYEMFAAVASALPFNLRIAHIHGGESTLGAIDNAFRHSITHMSHWHFACTEVYRRKIEELTGSADRTYNTGALGIDSLSVMNFLSINELKSRFGVDFSEPSILITLHPETIGYEDNARNAKQFIRALEHLNSFQQVITMPNADTSGLLIRNLLNDYAAGKKQVILIENFGSQAYLSAMKYSLLLLGNTSSGFMEASFFPKWVINTGNRQDGRIRTPNIVDVSFDHLQIVEAVERHAFMPVPEFPPVYGHGDAADKIIKILRDEFAID